MNWFSSKKIPSAGTANVMSTNSMMKTVEPKSWLANPKKYIKVYSPFVTINLPNIDEIKDQSDDFLGIREADIVVMPYDQKIEIGAALALRKQVLTVKPVDFEHPLLHVFLNWDFVIRYIQKVAND